MAQRQGEFTAAVGKLEAVRDKLTTTSSPEHVAVLREVAADLTEQVGPPPA